MPYFKLAVFAAAMLIIAAAAGAQQPDWVWAGSAGGAGNDIGEEIAVDAAGNSYVVGSFNGSAQFGATTLTSAGYEDAFIAKCGPGGNWLWARRAGGSMRDQCFSVAADAAGNCVITGSFYSPQMACGGYTLSNAGSFTSTDIFVAGINSEGDWLWAVRAGGTASDAGLAVALDPAGNACLTGSFRSLANFGPYSLTSFSATDIFAAKLSSAGSWTWVAQAGGGGAESGICVEAGSDGGMWIAGVFSSNIITFGAATLANPNPGYSEACVARLSPSGDWLWAKRGGGSGSDGVNAVVADAAGNLYVTGFYDATATFGTATLQNTGGLDLFAAKLDAAGNWVWASKAGGGLTEQGWDIALDGGSYIYIAGDFQGTTYFGGTAQTSQSGGAGYSTDGFIARISSNGIWEGVVALGGAGTDRCLGLAAGLNADLLVCGSFEGPVVTEAGDLPLYGGIDIFAAKINDKSLTLLTPNGGETYPANSLQSITWIAAGIGSVYLDYSLDAGASWIALAGGSALPANPGQFNWYVPNLNVSQAKVRIRSTEQPGLSDESAAPFVIYVPFPAPAWVSVQTAPAAQDAVLLSWNPVTSNLNGEHISPAGYNIYCSPNPGPGLEGYTLLAFAAGTEYLHATPEAASLFYRVTAVVNP